MARTWLKRASTIALWSLVLLQSARAQPLPTPPAGQLGSESAESAVPTIQSIEARRTDLQTRIAEAEAAATEESAARLGVDVVSLRDRTERLRSLDGVLQQQIGAVQRLSELTTSEADLDREIQTFETRGIEEVPPYPIAVADRHLDEEASERRQLDSMRVALESSVAERQTAEARLEEAERDRRRAREAAEANTDGAQSPRLVWEANRAALEAEVLAASLEARRLREAVAAAELALGERRLAFLASKSRAVSAQAGFARSELEARLNEIATRRDELERGLPQLRDTHQSMEALRRETREQLERATESEEIASLTAQLAGRTAIVDTAARAVELTEKRLQLTARRRELWERRYAVWQGAPNADLVAWRTATQDLQLELERDGQVQQARLLDLRTTILELDETLGSLPTGDPTRDIVELRVNALREREDALNGYIATLAPVERLVQRLTTEIDGQLSLVTWGERWDTLRERLSSIWNFELFVLEDDAITVRMIVIAFLILTVGAFMAGYFREAFRNQLLARTPLNENAAAAVEVLAYYVVLIGVVLYTLNFVRIPLTVFAFLGGAIAIAVGFGAQQIIGNFISGFILMIERPIRIGDLVEVEGKYGHIGRIGARSTRLRTPDNVDLLIPNSRLLENTVVNWTLSDEKLRTSVTVGVVYGSPPDTVSQLLLEATQQCARVLEMPKPVVLFTDFGDNALTFEVHFWLRMRRMMDKRQTESEVRHNIDRLFREHGIVIAFPQRDVHLDATKPIEVTVVAPDQAPSARPAAVDEAASEPSLPGVRGRSH